MWVLMKAVSVAVKGFSDCWSLLDFVELNVLIYFLWGLPRCKHGILEAVKQLFLVLFCDSR